MKVFLEVSQGAHRGKRIPIPGPQFFIGRDPQCHLRPASPIISRRHCALIIRDGKVYLKDIGSTNGVQVNGQKIASATLLHDGDQISMEPLSFVIHIEAPVAAEPKAAAPEPAAEPSDDESAAAMLLDMGDEGSTATGEPADLGGETLATTVMEMPALNDPTKETHADNKPGTPKKEDKKVPTGDTSSAAKLLLEKYQRRRIT
jgi:predicted component of type VI protein secretion system